jgi:hypothetical protein
MFVSQSDRLAPKRRHRRMWGIVGSRKAARSVRVAISDRVDGAARLELQAGAGAGEFACREAPWVAWRYKSPQPAPHFPAGHPVLGRGRHSMALLGSGASCSARSLFLQLHSTRRRAVTSIVQRNADWNSSRNDGLDSVRGEES